MRPPLTDRQRRHRKATSEAMRRHAAAMTCPACDRANALVRYELDAFTPPVFRCRYCGHEHAAGEPVA